VHFAAKLCKIREVVKSVTLWGEEMAEITYIEKYVEDMHGKKQYYSMPSAGTTSR
jgi:hypothetical protein